MSSPQLDQRTQSRLDSLRARIQSLDNTILELISERLTIAKEIGQIKKINNLPVKNFAVEEKKIKMVRELAPKIDLSKETAVNIMHILFKESISIQERIHEKSTVVKRPDAKKFLIVGGLGKMGQWLSVLLVQNGYSVEVVDRSQDERHNISAVKCYTNLPDLDEYDFIAICTPLQNLDEQIKEIVTLRPKAVVFDIASLKSHILVEIKDGINQGLKISSVHPLFGPSVKVLYKKNFLLCSCGNKSADEALKEIFTPMHLNVTEIPIEDHDKYIAMSLGLSHAINLIFGHVIHKSGVRAEFIQYIASTTFLKQLRTTKEVFSENLVMYHAIQHLNLTRDQLYTQMIESTNFVHELVKNQDSTQFNQFANEIKNYFQMEQ